MINPDLLKEYKRPKTEKLCPYKCQGMSFILYTNSIVKCLTCGKLSKESELLCEY